jgi:flavin reductase (DIM6/NTAB) family NADH-FMN oxidoreductase RutF
MELDEALGKLATSLDPAMAVVTTIAGGERAGCLVGFHAQCSITPSRYAVWLSKANHTHRVAMRASVLAVHFLDRDQQALAELFGATSGDDLDKFDRCDWSAGPEEVPVLEACPNRIVGRRVALLDEGSDHVCVIIEPDRAEAGSPFTPMRFSDVRHLEPGHEAQERPRPPTERAI